MAASQNVQRPHAPTIRRFTTLVVVVSLALWAPQAVVAQAVSMAEVEKALLAEDWSALADGSLKPISHDTEESPDPVLRFIKGHACVALNRNNESACLFLSLVDGGDLQKCEKWAERVFKDQPDTPLACYFKGDILARLGDWEEAVTVFSKGISLSDETKGSATVRSLIYNARGVVHLQLDRFDEANHDFTAAATCSGAQLADAFANLGAYQIQKRADPEMGIKCFTQALTLSEDFAFAHYGRACLRLIRGPVDDPAVKKAAGEDFEQALRRAGETLPLLLDDMPLADDEDKQALLTVVNNPGSSFVKDYKSLFQKNQTNKMPFKLTGAIRDLGPRFDALKPAEQTKAMDIIRRDVGPKKGFDDFHSAVQRGAVSNVRQSRMKSMKVEAQIGAQGVTAGGSVAKTFRDTRTQDLGTLRSFGGSTPGGISVSFEGSMEDLGDWPFSAQFTMMY